MKRIQYDRYGGPEVMELKSFEPPAVGKNEILVRVKAASVNPLDWKIRRGDMKFLTGRKFPRAMGQDFAGVVEAVGEAVKDFKPGDEVLGAAPLKAQGAFAERVVTSTARLVQKPAALSFEAAATLPTAGTAAWAALFKYGNLKPKQRVFINGALGGVGHAAVLIAKANGAFVAGRVGAESVASAEAAGIDQVLDYAQAISATLNNAFDIVFDAHGSLTPGEGRALAKPNGVVVDLNPSAGKVLRSLFSTKRRMVASALNQPTLKSVAEFAEAGQLTLAIGHQGDLGEAVQILKDAELGKIKGKAVIVMPD